MFTNGNEDTSASEERSFPPRAADDCDASRDAVDMAVLNSLEGAQVEGEPDIVVELMELYLEDVAAKLAAMREGLAAKDGRLLARLAHSLRGSSANLGARRAAALCEELEMVAEGERASHAGTLLKRLELELARVRNVFEMERQRRS